MSEWKIEYGNNTGVDDGVFWEWWTVTDGVKSFKCDSEEDAQMLLIMQNNEQAKASEWQPISTAPKDASHILVCRATNADGEPMGDSFGLFVQRVAWWESEGWISYCSLIQEPQCFFEPTHWMPIPAPPKSIRE